MEEPAIYKTDFSFDTLKDRHRAERDTMPESVNLRIHRALSWLQRAEQETDDQDARFIFLWVAFNAAYADELTNTTHDGERSVFEGFFTKLVSLDHAHMIYTAIWTRFSEEIRLLLGNRYVYAPFWEHHNQVPGYDDWEAWFERSKKGIAVALKQQNTQTILSTLFDRLYVLRNQLIHGGATWNSSVNRDQVTDGAAILSRLVPIFIELMLNHPAAEWGEPCYPVLV